MTNYTLMEDGQPLIKNLTAVEVQQQFIHHRLFYPQMTYYIVRSDSHNHQVSTSEISRIVDAENLTETN